MKLRKPIRFLSQNGNGYITKIGANETFTVKLDDGSTIKIDGRIGASVYQDESGEMFIKINPLN